MFDDIELNYFKSVLPENSPKLKKGDHIKVSLGAYEHHGVYTGEGTVVHRTQDGVSEVSLAEFSEGHFIEKVPHSDRLGKRKDVVRRARSYIGDNDYNLVFGNCEHFANKMISGRSESSQVNTAVNDISSFIGTKTRGIKHPKYNIDVDPTTAITATVLSTVTPYAWPISSIVDTVVDEKSVKKGLKKADKYMDKGVKEFEDVCNVGINIIGDIADGIKSLFD